MLSNIQLNDADKIGLSNALGFAFDVGTPDLSSATGAHRIYFNATTEGLTFDYCVPLMGILGSGTDKMFPVGKITSLRLELTCDVPANFILDTTANRTTSYTLSEVEFVANYVKLSPQSQAMIDQLNPRITQIRSQSYRQTAGLLTASTSGTNEIICNIRVNSLKSLYLACSPSNAAEGKYAGVNPNLGSGSGWSVSGTLYPQRGIDPSTRTADCFMELQKAQGALSFASYNGCISKNGYYVSSTAIGLCQAYNTNVANTQTSPNQFFMGIDTEVIARKASLLSGISTYTTGLMFRANISSALSAYSHTMNFFCIL